MQQRVEALGPRAGAAGRGAGARGDPPRRHDLPRAARRHDRGRQDEAEVAERHAVAPPRRSRVVNNGLALAAHFGDGALRRRGRGRRADRRGRSRTRCRTASSGGSTSRPWSRSATGWKDLYRACRELSDASDASPSSASATTGRARRAALAPRSHGARARCRARSRARRRPTGSCALAARRSHAPAGGAARLRARRAAAARSFYPFASFSPEWQAMRYALANERAGALHRPAGVTCCASSREARPSRTKRTATRRAARARSARLARRGGRLQRRGALVGGLVEHRARRARRRSRPSPKRWRRCAEARSRPSRARGAPRGAHAAAHPRRGEGGLRADRGRLRRLARAGARRADAGRSATTRCSRACRRPRSQRHGCRGRTTGCRFAAATAPACSRRAGTSTLRATDDDVVARWMTASPACCAAGSRRLLRSRHRGDARWPSARRAARPPARRAAGDRRRHRRGRRRRRRCALALVARQAASSASASARCPRTRRSCRCSADLAARAATPAPAGPRRGTRRLDLDLRKRERPRAQPPAAPARSARHRLGRPEADRRARGTFHELWQLAVAAGVRGAADRGGRYGQRPSRRRRRVRRRGGREAQDLAALDRAGRGSAARGPARAIGRG